MAYYPDLLLSFEKEGDLTLLCCLVIHLKKEFTFSYRVKVNMACLQCACVLLAMVSFSRAEDSNSETTVFKFSPLNLDDNYIVIQPNVPITKSTGI